MVTWLTVYPDRTPGERPGLSYYCDDGDHAECGGYIVTDPEPHGMCQCACHTLVDGYVGRCSNCGAVVTEDDDICDECNGCMSCCVCDE